MWYQYINLYINKFFKELQNLEVLEVPEVPKAAANKNCFSQNWKHRDSKRSICNIKI